MEKVARPFRVCLTGAESTGKTELAKELAAHFSAPCVPEFSREYAASPRLSFGAVGRYVGRSHLDNTNNDALATPPFFVIDATANYRWVRLQVNNLLNRKRVFPSGYAFDGVAYFYPQATRNALLTLHFNL